MTKKKSPGPKAEARDRLGWSRPLPTPEQFWTQFEYRRTYPLADGFEVEMRYANGALFMEWSPHLPNKEQARKLLPLYRVACNQFIASMGIPTLVIEI